ncbi:MAG: pantothenate kinase [Chloroflexi bacterium RBG_13_53_26]|jgi:type III pantothenate kinase|nr:MAG: pantothenate kinase [Chloroflexi bacterium RBG_13_53_26]
MLLAIDVGNSKVAFGIFEDSKLKTSLSVATGVHRLADEYASLLFNLLPYHQVTKSDIKEAIMCSVVPPLVPVFQEVCQRYLGIPLLTVGPGVRTGVRIALDNPREVGGDRIVNAAAAYRLYGGPAIVIDMGTATTFDVISKEGDYLGGAIAPGMEMATEALYTRTARLPRIELIRPHNAIGKNTVNAMQSGVIFGYVGLVEGLVARIARELEGKAKVIATGGYADVIARETQVIEEVNRHLTLHGLQLIHDLNRI